MADSAVAVTAGTGTNIDTRTESSNGNHRQVVVIGDPASNAGVAPVDATNGLAVDVKTLPASTNTIEVVGDAAEDAAVSGNPVLTGGRYDSTPRTLDDGDVGAIALDADGAVQVSDGGNSITIDGTVTANLSATDNAVLDSIDSAVSGTLVVDATGQGDIPITLDGEGVTISNAHSADYDSGAGTDTTVAFGIAVPASGGAAVIPGDATAGLKVNLGSDNDVTLATLPDTSGGDLASIATDAGTIAGAVSGSEIQVDIVADGAGLATSANQSTIIGHIDGVEALLTTIDTDMGLLVAGYATEGSALGSGILLQGDDGTDRKNINVHPTTGDVQVDVTNTVTVDATGAGDIPITLDGEEITVNLGSTDNAVLDNIQTAVELIDDVIYTDDDDWTDTTSKHILVGGLYQSSPQSITDGDVGPFQVDTNGNLKVNVASGSAAGTEYTEDDASAANPDGPMTMAIRADSLSAITSTDGDNIALRATNNGELYVKQTDAITANLSATDNAVLDSIDAGVNGTLIVDATGQGDIPITLDGEAVTVDLGANNDVTIDNSSIVQTEDSAHTTGDDGVMSLAVRNDTLATLASNDGDYTPLQVNASGALFVDVADGGVLETAVDGIETLLGTIDTDTSTLAGAVSSGQVQVDIVADGAGLLTTAAHNAAFGTAGTADTQVRTVQGIASMTPLLVDATGQGDVPITLDGESITVADIQDGAGDSVMDAANDALRVNIVAGSSSGTEYTEDAASATNPAGGAMIVVRDDARSGSLTTTDGDNVALRGTNAGELYVKHVDAIPITDNSGSLTIDQSTHDNLNLNANIQQGNTDIGSGNPLEVSIANTGANATPVVVDLGANNDVTVSGTVTANLGATDNAVLDDLVLKSSGIQSALGTNSSNEAANSSYSNWSTNTWTGTYEQNDYQYVVVSLQTDDAGGTLYFDFSVDGTNTSTFPVSGFTISSGVHEFHVAVKSNRYFRTRFVGTGSRSYFRLFTYYTNTNLQLNSPLNSSMSGDSDGVIVKAAHVVQYTPTPSSVSEDEFDVPSITRHRELRTRDQRAIKLQRCDDHTEFTAINNDTANLATSLNHVYGTGSITFDKVDGAGNTVFAGIQDTITSVDGQEIFEMGSFVGLNLYLPSIADVVSAKLRIGTDSSNYNEWSWSVDSFTAATWLPLRMSTAQPSSFAGNGWNPSTITYVAVVVEFSNQSDTLSGIIVDNINMVGGRVTDTTTDATVSTSISSPNINLHKVGNKNVDTNTGNSSTGTQRVVLASDQPTISVDLGANNDVTVTGSVTANAGTNLNTSALVTSSNFTNVLGTTSLVTTATLADNLANTQDVLNTRNLGYIFDGTTWDRQRGDSTNGTLVNLGSNNDVTVTSGAITETNSAGILADTASIDTNMATVAGAVSGSEMQVDVISSALPTGASTASNQSTIIGHLDGVEGSLTDIETNTDFGATTGNGTASGALRVTVASDSTGVISVDDNGGSLTVDGTVTETNSAAILADTASMDTNLGTVAGAVSGSEMQVDVVGALPTGTNTIGVVNVEPASSGGLNGYKTIDLDETEEQVNGTACQLYGWYIYNNAAATTYVKFYNLTAASTTVGTSTPVLTIPVPAGAAANVEYSNGIEFDTAMTIAATTGVADNDTGAPAANDLVMMVFWK